MLKNFNKPIINKREWQVMNDSFHTTTTGVCIIAPEDDYCDYAMSVGSAVSVALYNYSADSYEQVVSPALAGTFGGGTGGIYNPWSFRYTAIAGVDNTITVSSLAFNITGYIVGKTIQIMSGTQEGFTTTVVGILTSAGQGDIIIYLKDQLPGALTSGVTFRCMSGSYYVLNGGTKTAGNFKAFDLATRSWSGNLDNAALTNITGDVSFATAYRQGEYMAEGVVNTGSSTTMTSLKSTTKHKDLVSATAPNWSVDQWKNYQVTIKNNAGLSQTRTIISNTANTLTVSSAFLFTPDNTCTYIIEGNEDVIYLLGNNAVTIYKYIISTNLWILITPAVARIAVTGAGVTADIPTDTLRTEWSDENNIKDGRYIYSLRGGGSSNLDRYDIVTNKWEVVRWQTAEIFSTGTSAVLVNADWYIRRDNTNRFFKYNVVDNMIIPFSTIPLTDGGVVYGQKIHAKRIKDTNIVFIYSHGNTSRAVYRTLLY
jgi:hypothetical protein